MSESPTQDISPASSSSSDAVHFGSEPFATGHANLEFLKSRLPAWYVQAPVALREALRASHQRSLISRKALEPIRRRLMPVEVFAKPLLDEALYNVFKRRMDSKAYELHSLTFDNSYFFTTPKTLKQTLLQAALHNFDVAQTKAGGFPTSSTILPIGAKPAAVVTPMANSVAGIIKEDRLYYRGDVKIRPEAFAKVSHTLDLGSLYQAHLDSVFKPSPNEQTQKVASAFMDCERDAVDMLAHFAMIKAHITSGAYAALLDMVKPEGTPRWGGHAVRYRQLHMLDTYAFPGSLLYGALLIQQDIDAADAGPCLVYMPAEPDHPIKEYASFARFSEALTLKLRNHEYQRYFRRFVRLDKSFLFFKKLNERLAASDDASSVELYLQTRITSKPPFEVLYEHLQSKTYDDSRFIAVPSNVLDAEARRARLETLEAYGMDLLMVAGFFIPVLGAIMAVSAMAQLSREVFVAAEDWNHGETEEALGHLFNVGENLAVGAAISAAVGAVSQIQPSTFIESLTLKTLSDGQQYLWKPSMDGYAHEFSLADDATFDARGLIQSDGKTWLALDGKLYQSYFDATLRRWRISHPMAGDSYSPLLEHSEAGAWRHEWESPMGWDELTAFRRLNIAHEGLSEGVMRRILRVCNVDDAVLRQTHMEGLKPAALLMDSSQREVLGEHIRACIAGLKSAEPQTVLTTHLGPWMDLLCSSPRWPRNRVLLSLDVDYGELGNSSNFARSVAIFSRIKRPASDLTLALERALDSLTPEEVRDLMTQDNLAKPMQVQRLREHLAQLAQMDSGKFFEGLYQHHNRSNDPLVALVRRDFPGLPDVVAQELVDAASNAETARMTSAQRLPLNVAEQAREYLQHLRINRAIEGFYLEVTNNPDTLMLTFRLLEQSPGWPADTAIELRNDSIEGEQVAHLGDSETAAVHHIIVKTGAGYRPFCYPDTWFGGVGQSFFEALLLTLTDQTRSAIGLPAGATQQQLRLFLGDRALEHRDVVASLLHLQAIKPGFKWPSRLPDGRVGYPMSGRIRRLFRRLGVGASRYSPEMAIKSLFPSYSEIDINSYLEYLKASHSGSAAQLSVFLRTQLEALQVEYQTLETTLDSWTQAMVEDPMRQGARRMAMTRILYCWRRLTARAFSGNGETLGYELDLNHLAIGDLPEVEADFDHVVTLNAKGMSLGAENISAFLGKFRRLQSLDLANNGLQTMPDAIGQLTQLEDLSLSGNFFTLTAQTVACLNRLGRLRSLDLSYCPLGRSFSINPGNTLRSLNLRGTGIRSMPGWAWHLPELTQLDLRGNQLTTLSDTDFRNLNRLSNWTRMSIQLHDNPFDEPTREQALRVLGGARRRRLGLEVVVVQPAAAAAPHAWLEGLGPAQWEQRSVQWHDLRAEPGSVSFFNVLHDLRLASDYSLYRQELTLRVWDVIDAATENTQLRQQLFVLAEHPQTCGDGLSLIFSDLEIHARIFKVMASPVIADRHPEMFRFVRGLDRLDQVEKIARDDINEHLSRNEQVDEAEIRLAYRIELAPRLGLPNQSRTMLFPTIARVGPEQIEAAYQRIIARERTDEFIKGVVAVDWWMNYLEAYDSEGFNPIKEPFDTRMQALFETRVEITDQAYCEQSDSIKAQRDAAVQHHAEKLSRHISESVFQKESGARDVTDSGVA